MNKKPSANLEQGLEAFLTLNFILEELSGIF